MKVLYSLELPECVAGASWSADSRLLALTPLAGDIPVFNTEDGSEVASLPNHGFENAVARFRAGTHFATAGADAKVCIYEAGSWENASCIVSESAAVSKILWDQSGKNLGVAAGKNLGILDLEGKSVQSVAGHKSSVCDFVWNPASKNEFASVGDGGACMWKLGSKAPYARFDWGGASLIADWSSDGRWLVTGDQTTSVHLYDFSRDYPLHIQGYETKVRAVAFHPSGLKLATAGSSSVTLWDCSGLNGPEGSTPLQFPDHEAEVLCLSWSPDGTMLASGDAKGCVFLLEPAGNSLPVSLINHSRAISALSWSPCGSLLLAGFESGHAVVFSK